MYSKHDVDGRYYVWTIGGKVNKSAVISAHGAQTWVNSKFKIPDNVKLHFYQPNGYLLQDPGLINVIYDEVKPLETVSGGKSQDYSLSKYQGAKHGSDRESYQNIPSFGITKQELLDLGFKEADINNMKKARDDIDIISVRNRRFKTDPVLSDLIKSVHNAGYKYTDFYCSFCRGPAFSKEKGSWDATKNPVDL